MNKWVEKSVELANYSGYLDKLFDIYPIELGKIREISEETKKDVQKAFKNKDKKNLIEELLKFPKFPIDDPYVASLRRHQHLLEKNPRTISRIGKILLSINIDTILSLSTKAKSPSRQFGNSFRDWLHGSKYNFLDGQELKVYDGVAFLDGSDNNLKEFAIKELGIKRLNRRPDFLLKIKDKYILGEAKFLTDYGGTQNNQFDGALKMTKIKKDKVFGVAVIDGIVWFKSNSYMHRTVNKLNGSVFSALLLKEFIENLSK
ncbi:MAG: hypothetical protein AAB352_03275 [Patescibacteria group bacterium]